MVESSAAGLKILHFLSGDASLFLDRIWETSEGENFRRSFQKKFWTKGPLLQPFRTVGGPALPPPATTISSCVNCRICRIRLALPIFASPGISKKKKNQQKKNPAALNCLLLLSRGSSSSSGLPPDIRWPFHASWYYRLFIQPAF